MPHVLARAPRLFGCFAAIAMTAASAACSGSTPPPSPANTASTAAVTAPTSAPTSAPTAGAVDPTPSASATAATATATATASSVSGPPAASTWAYQNTLPPQGDTTVTLDDDGKSFALNRGAAFVVKLDLSGGTGYSWKNTSTQGAALTAVGAPTTAPAHPRAPGTPPIVGGGMVTTFRFKATAAGTATLEFELARSWEQGKAPAKTFHATVTVP